MSKLTAPHVAARLKSERAQGQARALRKAMTPCEKRLWSELRRHPITESHWRKQVAIGPFIVDFASHSAKLVVELDGGVHEDMLVRERDRRRQDFLEGRGYRVLRFTNADVISDVGSVVRSIQAAASPSSLSPRGRGGDISARAFLLHEDAHILVFNKPAGVAVQGGSGIEQSLEDMLVAFAKSNGKRPRLVHRLDRDTSGVIVVARTKPAAAFLSAAFAGRDVKKTYLAIVCGGAPAPPDGEIALALRKSSRKGLDIMEVVADGQAALTRYHTIAAAADAALLELEPETGRMHQLRAHLAAIGRPIAGDGKYGGLYHLGETDVPTLMLHAARLELPHPAGGRAAFEAPPPRAFTDALRSLELESASVG